MVLRRIGDLYPNYKQDIFGGDDVKSFSVYSDNDKKIGSVYDILVDENGNFRYFVINTGFLGLGKQVLLPVGVAKIDYDRDRIYAAGFTKEQAEALPEYDENNTSLDYDYEEKVRGSYRNTSNRSAAASGAYAGTGTAAASVGSSAYDRNSYNYNRDPGLYELSDRNHDRFKGYQDRFMTHKDRFHLRNTGDSNALYKIADLYPNYKQDIFGDDDLKGYSVYSDTEEKVGNVYDLLVDGSGHFRYFVVNTGFLGIGKKLLLPVGYASINRGQNRIYVKGFTKQQAQNLPEYNDDMTVDYDYEERVRKSYRTGVTGATAGTATTATTATTSPTYDRNTYSYDREPNLYQTNERDHQRLKLYEERLIANKERFNTGTVSIGKKVETETSRVSVPVEKERVVIERVDSTTTGPVTPDATAFREGEVARVDVYEEEAHLQKQTFVREEVEIRKEVERDTEELQGTVRREELDIDSNGEPIDRSRGL
jgi:uncharacterized protein (TIGR02271 family)